ncbi:MAG: hypothetical protein IJ660_06055 [Alphaproteobacteria bacterium]|nr:hypothetical protein [Alphaproteobacteria bacterium]
MLHVQKVKQIFADMLCVFCSLMGIFFLLRIFIEKDGILFLVMSFLTLECLFLWAAFRALRPYYGNGLSEWKDELREDGFAQTFTKLWLRVNMRLLRELIPYFFWGVIFLLIVVVTVYLYHHLQWVS